MASSYKKIIGKNKKLPAGKVIIDSEQLEDLTDIQAKDMFSKMKVVLGEDACTLLTILNEDAECFTQGGEGRIKKSEIIKRTGWKARKVDDLLEKCRDYIREQVT